MTPIELEALKFGCDLGQMTAAVMFGFMILAVVVKGLTDWYLGFLPQYPRPFPTDPVDQITSEELIERLKEREALAKIKGMG